MSWFLQPRCGRLPYSYYEESCVSISEAPCCQSRQVDVVKTASWLQYNQRFQWMAPFCWNHFESSGNSLLQKKKNTETSPGFCWRSEAATVPKARASKQLWSQRLWWKWSLGVWRIKREALGTWGRKNHTRKLTFPWFGVFGKGCVCVCVCVFFGGCFVDHRWGCVWVIIGHLSLLQNAAGRGFGCGATGQRSGFHTLLHGNSLARRWSEELLSAHFDHGQGARVTGWQSGVHGWT